MHSIPFHIYWSENKKREKLKFSRIDIFLSFHQPINPPKPAAKLRMSPPAMTDAI